MADSPTTEQALHGPAVASTTIHGRISNSIPSETEVQDTKTETPGELEGLDQARSIESLDILRLDDALPEPETLPSSSRAIELWTPSGSAALSPSTDGYSDNKDNLSPIQSPITSPFTPAQGAQGLLSASKLLSGVASAPLERPIRQLKRPYATPNQPSSENQVTRYSRPEVLFFIDDTESMKEHSVDIQIAFQILAYVAKSIDSDELELSFVSSPLDIFKTSVTSVLLEELRQHLSKHVSVKGMIESSLSTLMNREIMRRLPLSISLLGQVPTWCKPITVFVFTDGKWGEGVQVGNGLTAPISNMMRAMKKRGLNRTNVMFQFLRFGNDEKGREHMAYLDNLGKEEDLDIVDTRDISSNFHSMFHAGLTKGNYINKEHETAGPSSQNAIIAESPLRVIHEGSGEIGEVELVRSEDGPLEKEIHMSDGYESQDEVISAATPTVGKSSDVDPNLTLESSRERSPATSQDEDQHSSAITTPMSSRVSKWLTDRLWPPRHGSHRVWYLCGCNRYTYIDVEELESGGALENVRRSLNKNAAAVRNRPTLPQYGGQNTWQPNLTVPSPVHSGRSSSRGLPATPSGMTASNLRGLSTGLTIPTPVPPTAEQQTMHLLVCISGREYETLPKIRHLEITDKWDDGMLLRALLSEYEQARQGRQWSVSLLLPALPANFWHSSIANSLPEIRIPDFIRNSSLWEWWFRWAPDGGLWAPLYLPSTADFVKFQVVSHTATQEPYPDQFECGQWPSSNRSYVYKPVPMRLTTMNIPLWHELRYPGPHLGCQWFNASAKKLDGRLFDTPLPNDCLPDIVGYGIRINERINDVLILWWSWVVIILTAIFVFVYIKCTGDQSSAFSLGAYLVAAFTVYIQLQYAWWRRT